jgi:hypothetical protein
MHLLAIDDDARAADQRDEFVFRRLRIGHDVVHGMLRLMNAPLAGAVPGRAKFRNRRASGGKLTRISNGRAGACDSFAP